MEFSNEPRRVGERKTERTKEWLKKDAEKEKCKINVFRIRFEERLEISLKQKDARTFCSVQYWSLPGCIHHINENKKQKPEVVIVEVYKS